MRRLCIYLIYDANKVIDDYIGVALKELKRFSDRLVMVCNFDHIEAGLENVTQYADEIFCRKNVGYDAGGFQTALNEFVTWEKVYEYDELLLANDTWYGPIYSFDEMMDKMQNTECDFWGITRHSRGKYGFGDRYDFPSHIQSYFINYKRQVLHSKYFKQFWENYKCSNDRNETIERFEVGINKFLNDKGFIGKAYMDLYELPFAYEYNTNFSLSHSYELIRNIKLPVMKRTLLDFDIKGYVNIIKAYEYIKNETDYDYSLIDSYMERNNYKYANITGFDFDLMQKFQQSHARIFFYGHGVWGCNLADYFEYRGWHFDGYIVSEKGSSDVCDNVYCFNEMNIEPDDGIIIAQKNKSICENILDYISKTVSMDNVLTPIYR